MSDLGNKDVFAENLKKNIQDARDAAGMSQQSVASAVGTSRQQIGKYEEGVQDLNLSYMDIA